MATIIPIDFSQTPLATSYSPFYAKILDNVFSPKECADLIALASSAGDWSPAGLSAEGPTETVHTNFRNSDRVLVINDEVSSRIYEKLRPLVDEICEIAPRSRWSCITTRPGREKGPTWKMVRLVAFILHSWSQKSRLTYMECIESTPASASSATAQDNTSSPTATGSTTSSMGSKNHSSPCIST
jgi:hypothetical protein